jgi:hypothetical protein
MRRLLDILLVVILLSLTMKSVSLYRKNLNLDGSIVLRENEISKLKKINVVNSKIIAAQDSITLIKDKTVANLKMEVRAISKLTTQVNHTGFSLGSKTISVTELLTMFNRIYKENETNKQILQILNKRFGITYSSDDKIITTSYDSTSIINKYQLSEKQKIKIIRDLERKNEELETKAAALRLIQKQYNIPYLLEGNMIKIPDNRIDTLIDVYPLIKNRIKYDKERKHIWIRGLIL